MNTHKKRLNTRWVYIFWLAIILLSINGTWAAPALPILVETTQPDGSSLRIRVHGDEYNTWLETEQGYTVLKDAQDWWVYAVNNGQTKSLTTSAIIVGQGDPTQAGIISHLHPKTPTNNLRLSTQSLRFSPKLVSIQPVRGTVPTLVILIAYADFDIGCANCRNDNAVNHFASKIFGTSSSVSHYYDRASLGNMTFGPAAETHGTINDGIVGWLDMAGTPPDSTTFNSELTDLQKVTKLESIAHDALSQAKPYVNFASYDSNNNNIIDTYELAVVIVLAGYEELVNRDESVGLLNPDNTTSPRVAAHSTSFSILASPDFNGKIIQWFSILGERHADSAASMGVAAHELGHVILGWPDLYDTDFTSSGIGNWGLMGYGVWGFSATDSIYGETPVLPSAWSRMKQNWISPIDITNTTGVYTITQSTDSNAPTILRINTLNSNEYFLVENRQNHEYDAGLSCLLDFNCDFPGGLAIWHIDDSIGSVTNENVNNNERHKRVDLEAATGDVELDNKDNLGRVTNLYYADNKDHFDSATLPSSNLYDASATRINLYNISASGPIMTTNFALNYTPVIASISDKTVNEGSSLNFIVSVSDADGLPLPILNASGLPAGATFIDNQDGTGAFNWGSSVAGTYEVEIIATDEALNDLTDRELVTITVESQSDNNEDDGRCFIATAAYGSYLHPYVKTLREFRDNFLLTSSLGRSLVEFYYQHSPPIANFIAQHKGVRYLVRMLLTPMVYALTYPVTALFVLLLVGVGCSQRRTIQRTLGSSL